MSMMIILIAIGGIFCVDISILINKKRKKEEEERGENIREKQQT